MQNVTEKEKKSHIWPNGESNAGCLHDSQMYIVTIKVGLYCKAVQVLYIHVPDLVTQYQLVRKMVNNETPVTN